ncbi:MAG TPA: hypothetical protein VFY84_05475 [Jiangellales bacterium]|nr:hypothetical protein [Jiangellales bacterium]
MPTLIVLFLIVGARSPAVVAVPLIAGATIARILHAHAMLASPSLAAENASLAGVGFTSVTAGGIVGALIAALRQEVHGAGHIVG